MDRLFRNKYAIAVFVLPALLAYTIFVFYPVCQTVVFTFFEGTPNVNFEFVGIANYARLFKDRSFVNSFTVTMEYMLFTATGWLVIGLAVALVLKYGMKARFARFSRTIVYLPVVMPGAAAAALFTKVFEISPQYGLLNSLLSAVGLESMVQAWLGSSQTALGAVCFADIWKGAGYYAIIFYAGLINVPQELDEVARIDGANRFQIIKNVVMPIMRPVNIMCTVLAVMNCLKVYDMPRILTQGGPGYATTTLSLYMHKISFKMWEYGYGSTIAVVALVLTLALTQLIMCLDRGKEG